MKKVSMQDIADKVGVSRSLVSLAISNDPGVNEETRSKILFTALEMGYDFKRSKSKNKIVSSKKKITLLLQHDDIKRDNFWDEIVKGIEHECFNQGYTLNIEFWSREKPLDDLLFKILTAESCGIITFNFFPTSLIETLKAEDTITLVLIDSITYFGSLINHIRVNNFDGGYIAAEYLYTNGHRNVVFVGQPLYSISLQDRERGFVKFTSENNMTCNIVSGIPESDNIFNKDEFIKTINTVKPSAIMCVNDYIAKQVYPELRKLGYSIGKDISVMSMDGTSACLSLTPRLTSVNFSKAGLGIEAVRTIIEKQKNVDSSTKTILLPTSIWELESVVNLNKQ